MQPVSPHGLLHQKDPQRYTVYLSVIVQTAREIAIKSLRRSPAVLFSFALTPSLRFRAPSSFPSFFFNHDQDDSSHSLSYQIQVSLLLRTAAFQDLADKLKSARATPPKQRKFAPLDLHESGQLVHQVAEQFIKAIEEHYVQKNGQRYTGPPFPHVRVQ